MRVAIVHFSPLGRLEHPATVAAFDSDDVGWVETDPGVPVEVDPEVAYGVPGVPALYEVPGEDEPRAVTGEERLTREGLVLVEPGVLGKAGLLDQADLWRLATDDEIAAGRAEPSAPASSDAKPKPRKRAAKSKTTSDVTTNTSTGGEA